MDYYSLKMRASQQVGEGENKHEQHISGAERIVPKESVENVCQAMVRRAMTHSKGEPDFINLKIEKIQEEDIQILEALPVTRIDVESAKEGIEKAFSLICDAVMANEMATPADRHDTLHYHGEYQMLRANVREEAKRLSLLRHCVPRNDILPAVNGNMPAVNNSAARDAVFASQRRGNPDDLVNFAQKLPELLKETFPMRGAMLYDIATGNRLEPDKDRGVRATYMDALHSSEVDAKKNHFNEAIVLATKVANAPGIVAEICISDDPNYVTGYVASKKLGYVRIMKMKEMNDEKGGRIFLFDSRIASAEDCIWYLQEKKVLVNMECNK